MCYHDYLTYYTLLYSLFYTYHYTYYALLFYFIKLCAIMIISPIIHYYIHYSMWSGPSLREPLHTNPGLLQRSLTHHLIASTDVHLDMQEATLYAYKATWSAVFILLYAFLSLLCSLFPIMMFGQDSAQRIRDIITAVECTTIPIVMPS